MKLIRKSKLAAMQRRQKKQKTGTNSAYVFNGDRSELVAKLIELFTKKKLSLKQIAEAADCSSASASAWINKQTLPTTKRVGALVDLINKVK